MKTSFALGFFLSLSAFAHRDHDWREDYEAYLSVRHEAPFVLRSGPKSQSSSSEIDVIYMKDMLMKLSGHLPVTLGNEEAVIEERGSNQGLDLARAFLAAEYQKLGFEVSTQDFGAGVNFLAEKKGAIEPLKVLILSSHIDSVGNRGANDNGTGTTGLMAVARAISRENFPFTVRILGFDKEERGLRGSDAYVGALVSQGTETVIGNINFEMMGVNSRRDGAFHVIDCDRPESLFLSRAIKTAMVNRALALSVVKACTSRSDHASFWRRGIPAVVISENFFGGDADPCYHARCDVVDERLNWGYMSNILTAVLDATREIASGRAVPVEPLVRK